jgi:hypothetical protein
LAQRARELLAPRPGLVEKAMFGGLAFMLQGNMCCGVLNEDLVVRVGPDAYDRALEQPGAREFDFTGRPMKGWVLVGAAGCASDGALERWIQQGVQFALSLPAK